MSYEDIVRSVRPEVNGPSDGVRSANKENLMKLIDEASNASPGSEVVNFLKQPNKRGMSRGSRSALLAVASVAACFGLAVGVNSIANSPDATTTSPSDAAVTSSGDSVATTAVAVDTIDSTKESAPTVVDGIQNPASVRLITLAADQPASPANLSVQYLKIDVTGGSYEVWRDEDGSGYLRSSDGLGGDSLQDTLYPPGSVSGLGSRGATIGYSILRPSEIERLPTDAVALRAQLIELRNTLPDSDNFSQIEPTPDDSGLIDSIGRLLAPGVAPVELRSALFSVFTSIEGVEVTEGSIDPIGRSATSLAYTDEASGETVTIFLDPETTEVLASNGLEGQTVYQEAVWEAEVPAAPEGTEYDFFGVYSGCMEGGVIILETNGTLVEGPSNDSTIGEDRENLTQEERDELAAEAEATRSSDCLSVDEVLVEIEKALATL